MDSLTGGILLVTLIIYLANNQDPWNVPKSLPPSSSSTPIVYPVPPPVSSDPVTEPPSAPLNPPQSWLNHAKTYNNGNQFPVLSHYYPVMPVASEQIQQQLKDNQLSTPYKAILYGFVSALEMMGFRTKSDVKSAFISDSQHLINDVTVQGRITY